MKGSSSSGLEASAGPTDGWRDQAQTWEALARRRLTDARGGTTHDR
jgi:hypothetical protein